VAKRKYPEAVTNLENASRAAPRSAAAFYYLGIAQKSMGFSDSAKTSFVQARKLSPGTLGPEAALVELDARSGDYSGAERLARANPNTPVAEVAGAKAELAKGNSRKAEEMLQTALERDPVSLPALEILVKLYTQDGRAQKSVSHLLSLVDPVPAKRRTSRSRKQVFGKPSL
jgi:Tfp pilus assembly protein PilF